MSSRPDDPLGLPARVHDEYVAAEVVPEEYGEPRRGLPALPVILFLATCITTYRAGVADGGSPRGALIYAAALLFTLLCHEFGHYIQARRYRVPATLPLFIPMPIGPIGTMGAVIAMRGHMGSRKAVFDIGISGPLAGLVPALIFSWVGVQLSEVVPAVPRPGNSIGAPLLFHWIVGATFSPLEPGQSIELHPLAFAGWVGVFITALNLIPIGQLDGGHILYAILRDKAKYVAWALLGIAFFFVFVAGQIQWSLMLLLLMLMGPEHPPTANDETPLGAGRVVLGLITLLFVIIGFTPTPFM